MEQYKFHNKFKDVSGYISSRDGIALMMVLWILTILMVIAFSFSYSSRTETYSTLSFKDGAVEKFIAEAGIERGIAEIFYRRQNKDIEESDVWKIDNTPYSGSIKGGNYTVMIMDETGKIDINAVDGIRRTHLILKNLLMNSGVKEEDADTIIDSILDWRDPDDLYRLHGAESDYYMSLPVPYKAKNADFDTVEELILVKGMTREILYGNSEKKGIIDFLTVNTPFSAKKRRPKNYVINVKAAPRDVIAAIPEITGMMADEIISLRKSAELKNISDIYGIIGATNTIDVGISEGNTYSIESIGSTGKKNGGYGIRATIKIGDDNKITRVYYKSPAGIRQWQEQ